MIGVVIPARNEERYLHACLRAVIVAGRHEALEGEEVRVTVVLDDCSDASCAVVRAFDVDVIVQRARNVGIARAAGSRYLLDAGARWLAFTDADTIVARDWLASQMALRSDQGAEAVCGTVAVGDWQAYGEQQTLVRARFEAAYRDADPHVHIHGANFGVSARAYLHAGGFKPLRSNEDVALVRALQDNGAAIAWSAAPRVITSARRDSRARGGFGDTLAALAAVNQQA